MNKSNQGFFLLEALLAILIFSLGILAMVAMGATAMNAQSDAQYRTEAAAYANEIATQMWLNMNRPSVNDAAYVGGTAKINQMNAALALFAHQQTTDPAIDCKFTGSQSSSPVIAAWVQEMTDPTSQRRLPGATSEMQQILVDTSTGTNQVTITLCWQAPSDKVRRKHTLITYING